MNEKFNVNKSAVYTRNKILERLICDARKTKLMTREEELTAFKNKNYDLICSSNILFCISLAKKYCRGNEIMLNELTSECLTFMCESVKKFKIKSGVRFTTFLYCSLTHIISKFMSEVYNNITITEKYNYYYWMRQKWQNDFFVKNGQYPSNKLFKEFCEENNIELCEEFLNDISSEPIEFVGADGDIYQNVDVVNYTKTNNSILDDIDTDHSEYQCDVILKNFGNEKKQDIIRMKFGLKPYKFPSSNLSIAKKYDLAESRIRQIINEFLTKYSVDKNIDAEVE